MKTVVIHPHAVHYLEGTVYCRYGNCDFAIPQKRWFEKRGEFVVRELTNKPGHYDFGFGNLRDLEFTIEEEDDPTGVFANQAGGTT